MTTLVSVMLCKAESPLNARYQAMGKLRARDLEFISIPGHRVVFIVCSCISAGARWYF